MVRSAATRRTKGGHEMGDKNPKSKDKNKKQSDQQHAKDKAAHDKKQAPPPQKGK